MSVIESVLWGGLISRVPALNMLFGFERCYRALDTVEIAEKDDRIMIDFLVTEQL